MNYDRSQTYIIQKSDGTNQGVEFGINNTTRNLDHGKALFFNRRKQPQILFDFFFAAEILQQSNDQIFGRIRLHRRTPANTLL